MSALAIETEQLSKHFTIPRTLGRLLRSPRSGPGPENRAITAVDHVSLEVKPGELYGLLGPNGAGKTTLIKLLCTVIVPSSGHARIFGTELKDSHQILKMVGMASGDERSFYWRLTGRHNLEFFAVLCGLSEPAARRRSGELLEQVGLAEQADRPFRTYSSGQKQRLSIARALLHRPRLLFLDEPTRSLDPTATMALHDFIEEELLRREGMTILLTTHRLDEAQRLCHRMGIMNRGHLQAQGTPDELRAMLGPTVSYKLWVSGVEGGPQALGQTTPGALTWQPLSEPGNWLLELQAVDSEMALAGLIRHLSEAGGHVHDIQQTRPSLEQVFQRFTQP